jgi:flavin-dependent dehydrogenase
MPKRYIAAQHWFEREAVSLAPKCRIDPWSDYIGIFDSALTDFYIWMIPKSPQLIVGGAFPLGTNVSSAMQTIKEKLASLGLHLGTPFKREAGQILRPLRQPSLCFGDARTMLIGEASGLISPSSAEGISGALVSAFYLAEAFQQSNTGESGFDPSLYRRLLHKRCWSLWANKFKIPLMFNPLLRKHVMRSGITAMRR